MSLPSPILIYGDIFLSRNNLSAIKRKYPNYKWVTMSATNSNLDDIRMELGIEAWDDSTKIVLVNDIPNRKQVRDFLVDLASSISSLSGSTKLIIWDSNRHIKRDPKTNTIQKTWSDFVGALDKIKGSKVVDNGDDLGEKQQVDCITLVQQRFAKHKKMIDAEVAKLVVNIVGYDRGLLLSDIDKMAISAPDQITHSFVIENAFPTSNEAILYKFGNVLDSGSLETAILMAERFIDSGINHNVMAEVIVKKARWRMIACDLWASGMSWSQVNAKLMEMGKFPSAVWHHGDLGAADKRKYTASINTMTDARDFLIKKMGVPRYCFKKIVNKTVKVSKRKRKKEDDSPAPDTDKPKRGECIPMPFMAEQLTSFLESRVVRVNQSSITDPSELRSKIVNRSIEIYAAVQDGLARIRYGNNPDQDLHEMIRLMV